MKSIALLSLLAITAVASAADVRLGWETHSPATNFVIYATCGTNTIRVDTGTNQVATLLGIQPGHWSFQASAMLDGVESDKSAPLPVQVLPAPANLRTLEVQFSATLTNWQTAGFFRLKLEPFTP